MYCPPSRQPVIQSFTSSIMTNRNHPEYDPAVILSQDANAFTNSNMDNIANGSTEVFLFNKRPTYTVMTIKDQDHADDADLETGQLKGIVNTLTYSGSAEYSSTYAEVVAASPVILSYRYSFANIMRANPTPPGAVIEIYYPKEFDNISVDESDVFTECQGSNC